MNLTSRIRNRINELEEGITFKYVDLGINKNEYQTASKILERLHESELIKKVSKGIFYKPMQTVFGETAPVYGDQLKNYLFQNGKRIGYETGISLYYKLGLTTQMAFQIKIASRTKRIFINRGALKATAVKSYADVTDTNYELLGILDAIKDIKMIPDCTIEKAVKILTSKIDQLNTSQKSEIIQYALMYPARVRALLGVILENLNSNMNLDELKNSLHPLTTIKLGINSNHLPNIRNWNIK